ncbi:DNA binding domain with preference for A T rich regions [Fusarium albosuccineum]|uniref:DNA binding domain with preference for A T rich regions n=1 Tax=Fusarium albosuccineum TaxID=1237068 RepID=A0A8H4LAR1_9HYPO|nr:DNA binding domain with preference for A T rich regions [Fusarium albosuccineum]
MNPYILPGYSHPPPADANDTTAHPRASMPSPSPGLSPYHDGRIRNPVPSKLKGKTDGRQGNFSVMQIDVPRPEMTERDLAAKRTSEGTAAAARLASTQGYRHPKRSRPSLPMPPPPIQPREHPSIVLPAVPRPIPRPPPLPPAATADKPAVGEATTHEVDTEPTTTSKTSADDTKAEQARLLTLLRSLHPVLVVDQLCKALAYFGGIPGAPPPDDGVFPQSASANGSGSLFIAWISEIFPHLDNAGQNSATQTTPVIPPVGASGASSAGNAAPVTVKRSRGRPKGSKSSKVRKDKGIKKKGVSSSAPVQTNGTVPEATPTDQVPDTSQQPTASDQGQTTAVTQPTSAVQPATPHTGRKRGRPKGSKNKPKSQPGTQDESSEPPNNVNETQPSNTTNDSPLAHKSTSTQPDTSSSGNTGNHRPRPNGMATNTLQETSDSPAAAHELSIASDASSGVDMRPQPTSLNNQNNPKALSRKRKPSQQTSHPNTETGSAAAALQIPNSATRPGNSSQTQQAKRRRVSKETDHNNPAGATESPPTGVSSSASPNIDPSGQLPSTSSSFDSQAQMNALSNNANQRTQQLQRQHQNLNLNQFSQSQQQSPDMNTEQTSQTSQLPSPAANGSRSRLPGAPSRVPANMTAQAFYQQQQQQQQRQQQQRQMANQFGQSAGGSFSRTMGSSSPTQFQQQNSAGVSLGFHGRQSLSQHQHQQSPQQSQPQSTGSTPTPNMTQFQDFSGQNYLDMDYSMNPGTAAAFANHTQLEAALAEPDMRDRIYHVIGR